MRRIALVLSLVLTAPGALQAQVPAGFPSRPVTLVIPLPPGGAVDAEHRMHAQKLAELTRWQVLIDNRAGAGETLGASHVAKAPPDGYTILGCSVAFATAPALLASVPFDPARDFAPVSLLSKRPTILVVNATLPFRSLKDYLDHARANPAKVNFGTSGNAGPVHLSGAWLHRATATAVTFVHYNGFGGPFMGDLVAGRLDSTMGSALSLLPSVKAGKLRILGISSGERMSAMPDVPTLAEQGVAGYEYNNWLGILAPGATPPAVINRLSAEFARVARDGEIVRKLEAVNSQTIGSSPGQFREFMFRELELWKNLARDTGIRATD